MTKNIDKRIIDKGFHTGHEVDFVTIQQSDYEYLKEQAGRVQELENHIDHLYDNNVHLKGDYRLQEQNKRYREALEFYANKINYLTFIENGKSNIEHDQGEKARKALEGEE